MDYLKTLKKQTLAEPVAGRAGERDLSPTGSEMAAGQFDNFIM